MMKRPARALLILLALLFSIPVSSAAPQESSLDAVLDSLSAVRGFRQAAISPDGQRVAWVEAMPDAQGAPSSNSAIFITSLSSPSSSVRRITAGSGEACEEHEIAWSPDSRDLAFFSNAQTRGQVQLYVASVNGGTVRRLTDLIGSLDAPGWSPDGKTLALLLPKTPRAYPVPWSP